jgi:hypothetical protein
MRETILVGVPSAANRQTEYLPHMDTDPDRAPGTVGRANYYADYLLHNVRPMVDFNYRTKNDRANTACIGSSSGGLLATYLGTWTNAFGLVGAMSGVYSADFCPNFRTWLESARPHAARIWMDVGNVGGELNIGGISLYNDNFDLYWYLMGFGYVPNADLRFMIGCGHDHNEAAWAARLPHVYRFLLDVREEPNPLLAPEMSAAATAGELFPRSSKARPMPSNGGLARRSGLGRGDQLAARNPALDQPDGFAEKPQRGRIYSRPGRVAGTFTWRPT